MTQMAKPKNIATDEIILNVNARFTGEIHDQGNTKEEERFNADPLFS